MTSDIEHLFMCVVFCLFVCLFPRCIFRGKIFESFARFSIGWSILSLWSLRLPRVFRALDPYPMHDLTIPSLVLRAVHSLS